MIRAGIIGGAGYTAGELIRILLNHPEVELSFVQSGSSAGKHLWEVHEGIFGETDLTFSEGYDLDSADVLFLCSAHGRSREFWQENVRPEGLRVVDLAQDYRDQSDGYVYGLPELQRTRIASAMKVANPGCFATAIQLSLLPLAAASLLEGDIAVNAVTGSTGAGVKPSATTHFSWRNNNISAYKVFTHQHLLEIDRNLRGLQPENWGSIGFVPLRGDFARGIFATAVLSCPLGEEELTSLYRDFYADASFTFHCPFPVDLKQVVNTNKCLVHAEKHGSKAVITAAIDNLLKGASGQAVQNMNIMFGLDEKAGLRLKSSAF